MLFSRLIQFPQYIHNEKLELTYVFQTINRIILFATTFHFI
jgi:hypothetical protein